MLEDWIVVNISFHANVESPYSRSIKAPFSILNFHEISTERTRRDGSMVDHPTSHAIIVSRYGDQSPVPTGL